MCLGLYIEIDRILDINIFENESKTYSYKYNNPNNNIYELFTLRTGGIGHK